MNLNYITSVDEPKLINDFRLFQNYPNPFNPITKISFELNSKSFVELKIFNILGQEVRSLTNQEYEPGRYELLWDGKDRFGKDVASGMYFYRLSTFATTQTMKMILSR